jgi:beta-glucosidase
MPDLSPSSITVNGKAIPGFDATKKVYSYLLTNTSAIPEIKATATNKNTAVEIEQAKGVPGTAIVNFIDYNTFEKNSYYFSFDVASVSDEFNGAIGPQWQWIREDKANHNLSTKPGSLTITTEPGDVSESSNNAKNLLLQSANNDWTIETKLVCSRTPAQPENAGIIAYQDDDNFLKLMFRAVIKTRRQTGIQPGSIDLLIEENGIAKSMKWVDIKEQVIGNKDLFLKLEKKGSIYNAYYSWDGVKYELLATADIMLKDIRAGLIACDGVVTQSMTSTFYFDKSTNKPDTPFDVSFDYFRITNSGLK